MTDTIEIFNTTSDLRDKLINLGVRLEPLGMDARFWNVYCNTEDVDKVTDILDEAGIPWRLI